jgi:trk system potassium uptake protein TrkA
MRILIVGGGEIGYALARALAADHGIFVVDHSADVGERFVPLDVEFVHGSATSADVLRRAQVEGADLLIGCTGLDEVNLVACAIANRFKVPRTICFVSREDFLSPEGSAESLREHFGIERVVWPEAQLADEIERIIAAPGAIDAEVFAEGRIRLLEYRLQPGSPLTAGPISSLRVPHRALIVAVKHRDTFEIPRGDTRLAPDDKIVVMGTPEALLEFQPQIQPKSEVARRRQLVTIIGGGDVGFRLAQRLDAARDVELRILEKDRQRGELLASSLRRALVLNGDGTDLEFLEAEEIGRSDVLVSVIDNDERNLLDSLLGRQLGVQKIITRVYLLVFAVCTMIVIALGADIMTGITATIATLGNIGPGFNQVGPMSHFGDLHPVSKIVLTAAMWIGRLEVLTVLALLRPEVWRRARFER